MSLVFEDNPHLKTCIAAAVADYPPILVCEKMIADQR